MVHTAALVATGQPVQSPITSGGPLSRIGRSLKSGFLEKLVTGASAAAEGVDASTIRLRRGAVDLQQQELETNQAEAARQQRQQELANEAFGGGPNSDRAAAQMAFEFPEIFEQISESMGLRSQAQKTEAADFALRLQATPFEERQTLINQRVTELAAVGRDPQHTASLSGLSEEDQNNALRVTGLLALTPEQRARGARGGIPAEQQTFESLIAGFDPEEQERARRVEAGLSPRAVGAATITTATTPGLTEQVAVSQEEIRQRTKFAEMTGASRAKAVDKGFTTIQSIDKNVRNIDRAITALNEGASTGAIESRFFPSIREASVVLDQIQGELALDVVGAVTFGALSQGELDLARSTALPTGLQPPELINFLQERKIAQEKLRDYYVAQIDHLDQGGSIASFLRQQQRQAVTPANDMTDEQIRVELGL